MYVYSAMFYVRASVGKSKQFVRSNVELAETKAPI